jgi:hypothetical protein
MDVIGGRTMAMTADPCGMLERKVGDRVRDDESHRRVSEALTDVAIAAIHPARHLGVGRAPSRGMLDDPIESATQAAVETLIRHLDDLVESLPNATVSELACEQAMAERGLE